MDGNSTNESDLFLTTHWTVVRRARDHADEGVALDALTSLCEAYWYPVYAYVRRRGNDAHRAEDLTQGFFLQLIEKDRLQSVAQEKGKFRAFLLAAVKNYMANVHDHETAQKRGGGQALVHLDSEAAEGWYAAASGHQEPDASFDYEWAMTVLRNAQVSVKRDYEKVGNGRVFAALFHTLTGDGVGKSYVDIGEELGMSENAVKVAAHRLRSRYRKRLREAVAHTVGDEASIDDELKYLIRCV